MVRATESDVRDATREIRGNQIKIKTSTSGGSAAISEVSNDNSENQVDLRNGRQGTAGPGDLRGEAGKTWKAQVCKQVKGVIVR